MKFMVLIYNDDTMLDAMPQAQFDATMRGCLEHADELRKDGRLLDSQMLEGASTAKSLRSRKNRLTVVDGPYAETKELLAGFNLIEAENMDEAVRIAATSPISASPAGATRCSDRDSAPPDDRLGVVRQPVGAA